MSHHWRLSAHVDFGILGDLANSLAELEKSQSFDWSLYDEGDIARLDVLFEQEPDIAAFRIGAGLPDALLMDLSRLAEKDRHILQEPGLKSFRIARFVLCTPPLPVLTGKDVGIEIDAGDSFGSGRHPSTRGCLEVFDALLDDGFAPRSVLDMGCGSAILAIAAAKALPRANLIAVDADHGAVSDGRANCARNGVDRITCFHSEGYDHDRLRDAQFDLVFVNIYGPLHLKLTPATSRAIAPGGRAILSGLQLNEEDATLAVIQESGLNVLARRQVERWVTLVVEKPVSPSGS